MKITLKQLKQIIKEEINRFNRTSAKSPAGMGHHAQRAADMSDEELMKYLQTEDPNCEHDDLSDPDGPLAVYWREVGDRGLLDM